MGRGIRKKHTQEVTACRSMASEYVEEAVELWDGRPLLPFFFLPFRVLFLSMLAIDSAASSILRYASQILPELKSLFSDSCGSVLVRNWGIKEAIVLGKD